ncbi:hypothetical protein E4U43_004820 [Claviceps pusilla]|uniref:AA1-like domain-containing protein n=1 Tax=Claviceps pusilla TaxID=123648 RepID=A0A9P7N599_9HYPO|nr:hypothetical protein E4U43_004820 [Claviceps pusilla]
MKAFTILSLATSLVAAARPGLSNVPSENVDIRNFNLQKTVVDGHTVFNFVSFVLEGANKVPAVCRAVNLDFGDQFENNNGVFQCDDGGNHFTFGIHPGATHDTIKLSIYHQLRPAVHYTGSGDILLNCVPVPTAQDQYRCSQANQNTIVIQ